MAPKAIKARSHFVFTLSLPSEIGRHFFRYTELKGSFILRPSYALLPSSYILVPSTYMKYETFYCLQISAFMDFYVIYGDL